MCCTEAGSWRRGRTDSSWCTKGDTGPWCGPRPTAPMASIARAPSGRLRMGKHTGWRWAIRDDRVLDLADCTEYRQALEARPPAIVHGTAGLLSSLLGVALAWSALTRADLVVRAPGRVRPVATTVKVFPAVRGEVLSASTGGRVAAVHFREGDRVLRGAVLIRLETARLDNEIAKQRRSILAGEEELARLVHLQELATRQFEVALSKAEAELEQAGKEVRRASELRDAEIRLAEVALE